jgi:hypothetical protein
MGSAVALAVTLTMTAVVFVFLYGDYASRLAGEQAPLIRGLFWSWSFSVIGAAAFYGEIRQRTWRLAPQLGLALGCALLAWRYWP